MKKKRTCLKENERKKNSEGPANLEFYFIFSLLFSDGDKVKIKGKKNLAGRKIKEKDENFWEKKDKKEKVKCRKRASCNSFKGLEIEH